MYINCINDDRNRGGYWSNIDWQTYSYFLSDYPAPTDDLISLWDYPCPTCGMMPRELKTVKPKKRKSNNPQISKWRYVVLDEPKVKKRKPKKKSKL